MQKNVSTPPDLNRPGHSKSPTLSPQDYSAFQVFLEAQAGIRLGPGKEYLVSSRLSRLLAEHGLPDFRALTDALRSPAHRALQAAVVDAMTTNETFWFRDPAHYAALTDGILPEFKGARMRIWSAAASTGQEAYTIAICLEDEKKKNLARRTLSYEIVGTDISPTALREAQHGIYCGVSAGRGLTNEQRQRYFREDGGCLEVHPDYRRNVRFQEFNLLRNFDTLGKFDVVFCRNVLIYFSQELKRDIVSRIARSLNPGGYLLLGSTESMSAHTDLFEMQRFGGALVYRKRI